MNNCIKITESPSLYDDLEHKTVREIIEEINTEDQRIALAVKEVLPQIEKLVETIIPRMCKGGRLFYMGAGTSGRLGVLDASEIPPTFGLPAGCIIGIIAGGDRALRSPVENAEDDTEQGWNDLLAYQVNRNDTVVGIAASGTTPYVIGALRSARKEGLLTASIASNPNSSVSAEVDIPIEIVVGPEYVTGSSRMKSGTGQKMILNIISTTLMIKMGRVKGNKMVNMQLTNQKLIERGIRMLMEELHVGEEQARTLLMIHGSVSKALAAFKSCGFRPQ